MLISQPFDQPQDYPAMSWASSFGNSATRASFFLFFSPTFLCLPIALLGVGIVCAGTRVPPRAGNGAA